MGRGIAGSHRFPHRLSTWKANRESADYHPVYTYAAVQIFDWGINLPPGFYGSIFKKKENEVQHGLFYKLLGAKRKQTN